MPDQTPSLILDPLPQGLVRDADAGGADPRPGFFLHIPKTAGTSFVTMLQNLFGERRVLRLALEDPELDTRIDAVMTRQGEEVACLNGHLPADVMDGRMPYFRPFTILRDPIARVFSLFRFQRRNPDIERLGLRRGFSFESFLAARDPALYPQLTNGMCRMLAGERRFSQPGDDEYTHADQHPELIERALAQLEAMDFGLAEHMGDTLRLLRHHWDIPFALDAMVLNTTGPDAADQDWRNVMAVVERNRLDIVLYERAKDIFRSRLAALASETPGPGLQGMVFQPPLGQRVLLPDVAGRQGFHPWEDSGISWLNEGPPARIHFVPPAPISRINLRLFSIGSNYPFDRVRLHLHGYPLPFSIVERNAEWCTIETRLARAIEGVNTLAITAPLFVPVRSLDPASIDTRNLGIALESIAFSR